MTNEEIDEFTAHRCRIAIGNDEPTGAAIAYLYGIFMLLGEIAKRLPEKKKFRPHKKSSIRI